MEALKKNNFELDSGETGIVKWIDEIIWREFYKNIMHSFPKVSKGMPFQDYTKILNGGLIKMNLRHGRPAELDFQ